MRKCRRRNEQSVGVLQENETGRKTTNICRLPAGYHPRFLALWFVLSTCGLVLACAPGGGTGYPRSRVAPDSARQTDTRRSGTITGANRRDSAPMMARTETARVGPCGHTDPGTAKTNGTDKTSIDQCDEPVVVYQKGAARITFGRSPPSLAEATMPADSIHLLVSALDTLAGTFVWSTILGTYKLETPGDGKLVRTIFSLGDRVLEPLVTCIGDTAEARVVLRDSLPGRVPARDRPALIGALCAYLLTDMISHEEAGSLGYMIPDWPGYVFVEDANGARLLAAQRAWRKVLRDGTFARMY